MLFISVNSMKLLGCLMGSAFRFRKLFVADNQVEEERANDIHLNNEKQKEFNALDASIKVS
jgi:hypothetical protein